MVNHIHERTEMLRGISEAIGIESDEVTREDARRITEAREEKEKKIRELFLNSTIAKSIDKFVEQAFSED